MKSNILVACSALWFFLATAHEASSQGHISFCGMEETPAAEPLIKNSPDTYRKDGLAITAHGELKVLMVLVEFKDETWDPRNPYWPTEPATPGQPIEAPFWVEGSVRGWCPGLCQSRQT